MVTPKSVYGPFHYAIHFYSLEASLVLKYGARSWVIHVSISALTVVEYVTMVHSNRPDNSNHGSSWSMCGLGQAPFPMAHCTSSPGIESQTFCTTQHNAATVFIVIISPQINAQTSYYTKHFYQVYLSLSHCLAEAFSLHNTKHTIIKGT